MRNKDHRADGGNLPGCRGKDREPLPGAEDEQQTRPRDPPSGAYSILASRGQLG